MSRRFCFSARARHLWWGRGYGEHRAGKGRRENPIEPIPDSVHHPKTRLTKELQLAALRFPIFFATLFIVSLPFPYYVLPEVGVVFAPFFEMLVRWTGDHLFAIGRPYTAAIVSDSTGIYIHTVNLLILSAVMSVGWWGLDRRR